MAKNMAEKEPPVSKPQLEKKPKLVWPRKDTRGAPATRDNQDRRRAGRKLGEKESHLFPPPPEKPPRSPGGAPDSNKGHVDMLKEKLIELHMKVYGYERAGRQFVDQLADEVVNNAKIDIVVVERELAKHKEEYLKTDLGKEVQRAAEAYEKTLGAVRATGTASDNMTAKIWEDMNEYRRREGSGEVPEHLIGMSEYVYFDALKQYGTEVRRSLALYDLTGKWHHTEWVDLLREESARRGGIHQFIYEVDVPDENGNMVKRQITGEDVLNRARMMGDKSLEQVVQDLVYKREPGVTDEYLRGLRRDKAGEYRYFKQMWIHPRDSEAFEAAWAKGVENNNIEEELTSWLHKTVAELMSSTDEPIRSHPETQQRLTGLSFLISEVDLTGTELRGGQFIEGVDNTRKRLLDQMSALEDNFNLGYVHLKGGGEGLRGLLPLIARYKASEIVPNLMNLKYEGKSIIAEGIRFMDANIEEIIRMHTGEEDVQKKLILKFMQQLYPDLRITISGDYLSNIRLQQDFLGALEGINWNDWPNINIDELEADQISALYKIFQYSRDTAEKQQFANLAFKSARAFGLTTMLIQDRMLSSGFEEDLGGQDFLRRLIHMPEWMLRWGIIEGNSDFWEVFVKEEHWDEFRDTMIRMEKRDVLSKPNIDLGNIKFFDHDEAHKLIEKSSTEKQRLLQELLDSRPGEALPDNVFNVFERHPFWFDTETLDFKATRPFSIGWRTQADYDANKMFPLNNLLTVEDAKRTDGTYHEFRRFGIRLLTESEARNGDNVKKFVDGVATNHRAEVRKMANYFIRSADDYNAESCAYYKLSQETGINFSSIVVADFTAQQKASFERYYTSGLKEKKLVQQTIQGLLDSKFARITTPAQQASARDADVILRRFKVRPNETIAPLSQVRFEDMRWDKVKDDWLWRAYRDMEGNDASFGAMLGVAENLGQRPEVVMTAIENFNKSGGMRPHKGVGENRKKIRMFMEKSINMHKIRYPSAWWVGAYGMWDMQEWEKSSYKNKSFGEMWKRFPHVPFFGRFIRDKHGIPLNRSEVTDRTKEIAWSADEIYPLIEHSLQKGWIGAQDAHHLESRYKQNEFRTGLEKVFNPLYIAGGFFESLKDFWKGLNEAYKSH